MTGSQPQPLLSCRGLTKRFGGPAGVLACDGVDLDLFPGRIHALLGENGAGKSTLMAMLAGSLAPDSGSLLLGGSPVALGSPAAALTAGVGMVHQRFSLVTALTGAENLALALPGGLFSGVLTAREASALAEGFGLGLDMARRVADLGMGERQRLEILKLLARDARLLILDEPTSVLAPAEIDGLYAILRRLAVEGRAVVLVTHKLAEVAGAADEVSVLRRGRMLARSLPRDPDRADGWDLAGLSRLMVGREPEAGSRANVPVRGETVLRVRGLRGRGRPPAFSGVTFEVARGEVFALVGVAGNGQEALAAVLGGLAPAAGGEAELLGRPAGQDDFRRAAAYVPEDRHGTATVPGLTLAENIVLSTTSGRGAILARGAGARGARAAIAALGVAAGGAGTLARELSGGNLQKFILARELAKAAPLLVVEQPTQGLDVLAVAEVHAALRRAAEEAAVLVVTGDPAEALALAGRVGVLYRGRLGGVVAAGEPGAFERVGRLMAGLDAEAEARP